MKTCHFFIRRALALCAIMALALTRVGAQSSDTTETLSEYGAYGLFEMPIGDYSELLAYCAGGGVSYFRKLTAGSPVSLGARAQGLYSDPSTDRVSSWWNLAFFAGASFRLPINRFISINPELDAGLWMDGISWYLDVIDTDVKAMYYGTAIQASVAARVEWNSVALEIAPVVTALPKKSSVPLLAGVRVGVTLDR
jgi:hypothetical protein